MTSLADELDPKWAALDPDIKRRAVEILRAELADGLKEDIAREAKADPVDWVVAYHFGWGMWVRNLLRHPKSESASKNPKVMEMKGIRDDELPGDDTWDDYYGHAVEVAVGVREPDWEE